MAVIIGLLFHKQCKPLHLQYVYFTKYYKIISSIGSNLLSLTVISNLNKLQNNGYHEFLKAIFKKILEVNLFAFAYRLLTVFHEDFSQIDGALLCYYLWFIYKLLLYNTRSTFLTLVCLATLCAEGGIFEWSVLCPWFKNIIGHHGITGNSMCSTDKMKFFPISIITYKKRMTKYNKVLLIKLDLLPLNLIEIQHRWKVYYKQWMWARKSFCCESSHPQVGADFYELICQPANTPTMYWFYLQGLNTIRGKKRGKKTLFILLWF